MKLPDSVLCEKCGVSASVINNVVDDQALAGKMAPTDRRWEEGIFFAIECPNCGTRMQCLSPPPGNLPTVPPGDIRVTD